jgi:hypothetical protein
MPPSQGLPAVRHARAASIRHKVTRAPRPIASERAGMRVDISVRARASI